VRVLLLTHRSFDWNHRRLHALCHDGGLHQDVCKDALARKALSCSQTAACMAAKEPPEQTRVTLCAQARRSLPSMTPWILRSVAAFRFRSHTCASKQAPRAVRWWSTAQETDCDPTRNAHSKFPHPPRACRPSGTELASTPSRAEQDLRCATFSPENLAVRLVGIALLHPCADAARAAMMQSESVRESTLYKRLAASDRQ